MPSVYSTRFYIGAAPSSQSTVYTVPAGFTAVIRDLEAFATSAITDPVYLVVQEGSGPVAAVIADVGTLGALQFGHWEGRAVMVAGDELIIAGYGSDLLLCVSGYLLSN